MEPRTFQGGPDPASRQSLLIHRDLVARTATPYEKQNEHFSMTKNNLPTSSILGAPDALRLVARAVQRRMKLKGVHMSSGNHCQPIAFACTCQCCDYETPTPCDIPSTPRTKKAADNTQDKSSCGTRTWQRAKAGALSGGRRESSAAAAMHRGCRTALGVGHAKFRGLANQENGGRRHGMPIPQGET